MKWTKDKPKELGFYWYIPDINEFSYPRIADVHLDPDSTGFSVTVTDLDTGERYTKNLRYLNGYFSTKNLKLPEHG